MSRAWILSLLVSSAAALNLPNPFASKQDGATVMKLQLAFRCGAMDRGVNGVLGALGTLADEADAGTAEGIEQLAADTALLLLRRETEWVACAGTVAHYRDDDDALRDFDKLCISESAKFERENPDRSSSPSGLPMDTVAVVTAIACCMGNREDAVGGKEGGKFLSGDASGIKAALAELAAAGNAGGEIFGFELMWVPDDDEEALSMEDVAADWPEVLTC